MLEGGWDGDEVLCAKRAVVIRSECVDVREKEEAQVTGEEQTTVQVLEVEEVQGRRGLRIAGGADDRVRREMQIGDTLQVDGKRTTLQDATRERPRRIQVPDEARRGWEHIDVGEDRVIGETVGDGLCVREVDHHGLQRLNELPGEHCGGAATSLGIQ